MSLLLATLLVGQVGCGQDEGGGSGAASGSTSSGSASNGGSASSASSSGATSGSSGSGALGGASASSATSSGVVGSSVATSGAAVSSSGSGGSGAGGAGGTGGFSGTGGNVNIQPGFTCTSDSECMSGFCVTGVCCSTACSGVCETCNGFMPGTCSLVGAGTECGPPVGCSGGSQTDSACDSNGGCHPRETACAPYVCGATACETTCATDADCLSGFYCSGTDCVAMGTNGAACTTSDDCTSGFCVEGVCCDTACSATCYACSAALTGGTNGICGFTSVDTPCGTPTACSAGTETVPACDGAGTCAEGAMLACAPFVCGASACTTTCASDTDCAAGAFCSGSTCVAAQANGATCTVADQCASGFCAFAGEAEGKCCNTACNGTCQACAAAQTGVADGVCANILTGLPAPINQCPPGFSQRCGDLTGLCQDGACAIVDSGPCNSELCGAFAVGTCTSAGCIAPQCLPGEFCGPGQSTCTAVQALAAGGQHTCALLSPHSLAYTPAQCWGANANGQLGDGATMDSSSPMFVLPYSDSDGSPLSAGGNHTCMVLLGELLCWGSNESGEVGNGSTMDSPTPVEIITAGVTAVAAGAKHTCAVVNGGVECWGDDTYGQLGNGSMAPSVTPTPVPALTSGVSALAAGVGHTCALTTAGGVLCWGDGSLNQLGNGSSQSSVPVAVTGLSTGVTAIAAGDSHTCAVLTSGALMCWGDNAAGQLGGGSTATTMVPVSVMGLPSAMTAVTGGTSHTCALSSAGAVLCWGDNGAGQLGTGSMSPSLTPIGVTGLSAGVTGIAAGGSHTCALPPSSFPVCWGDGVRGDLGNGATAQSSVPVTVSE